MNWLQKNRSQSISSNISLQIQLHQWCFPDGADDRWLSVCESSTSNPAPRSGRLSRRRFRWDSTRIPTSGPDRSGLKRIKWPYITISLGIVSVMSWYSNVNCTIPIHHHFSGWDSNHQTWVVWFNIANWKITMFGKTHYFYDHFPIFSIAMLVITGGFMTVLYPHTLGWTVPTWLDTRPSTLTQNWWEHRHAMEGEINYD